MTICKRCVMDTTDPNITFDEHGVCNHCKNVNPFEKLVKDIKSAGRGKRYDCLEGLSGGCDSSYLALLAWKHGLRVLTTQLDNGWGTPEADHNVKVILDKTGWDFKRCIVSAKVFDDLHIAYLKASVVDIEVPSDHAIAAWNYSLAAKEEIHYIISGSNTATEGIMPLAWGWNKGDLANIRDIHRRYGKMPLSTFPTMGPLKKSYYELVHHVRQVFPLNLVDYNREIAKEELAREFGWKDYGLKHFESIITRFYQGYILPKKFGIDKRKAHYSALICSGQMTREEALDLLSKPIDYPQLEEDKKIVFQRLGFSEEEFEAIMNLPIRSHKDFKSDEWIFSLIRRFRFVRKFL